MSYKSALTWISVWPLLLIGGTGPAICQNSPDLAQFQRASIVSEDANSVVLNFRLPELSVTQASAPQSIAGLPVVSHYVVVPPTAGLELHIESGEGDVIPADPPDFTTLSATDGGAALTPKESLSFEGIYPSKNVVMSEPEVIRGVRVVRVTAYPLQYDYGLRAYISHPNLNATIRFTANPPVNPVEHPIRRGRSKAFLKYIAALAINGDDLGRDDPDRDSPNRSNGHYLIVTREECLPFIRPFIEWRRKSGYAVDIMSLAARVANDPRDILNAIQNQYDAYLEQGLDPFDEILLVGDRRNYADGSASQWILESFNGSSTWADPPHADYLFSCLEGDDDNPDVGVSRWWAGAEPTLQLAVGRTLAYEATPYWQNQEWFSRSGAYYQHWGSTPQSAFHPSMAMTTRWAREAMTEHGYQPVEYYENFEWDERGIRVAETVGGWFTNGASLLVGRAQIWKWANRGVGGDFDFEPHPVYPINLMMAGYSNWTAEVMTRTGDAEHLKGPSAMTCGWGDVPTLWMNAALMELTSGVVQHDLPLGWARLLAVNSVPGYLGDPGNIQHLPSVLRTDIDCYGDPAIQPWLGTPREVSVNLITAPEPHRRLHQARVVDPDNNPVAGIVVTLYAAGEIPDDPAQYANYTGFRAITATSDQNGLANFLFDDDPDLAIGTSLFVTAVGRDVKPAFFETQIAAAEISVALDGFALTEVEGNGDNIANPGETLALRITARNDGNQLDNVAATLTSNSPWLEIVGENQIVYGALAADGESDGDRAVTVRLNPSTPDGVLYPGSKPTVRIEFRSGDQRWSTALRLDPRSPGLTFASVIGGDIIPDSICRIDVQIANLGGTPSAPFTAELYSLSQGITVIREQARYPGIAVGESAQIVRNLFEVAGNAVDVPGARYPMQIILSTDAGFIDTVNFNLQVMVPRANAPQVPDPYGYICFDDSDTAWDMAPDYRWIEICPTVEDADFQGERLDFRGESELDIGEALAVGLGFETQFYGERFDTITVATNGFIAMGNEPHAVSFQNYPLDRGIGGAAGMIAPFWTDLRLSDSSGVYIHHDEESARFIVEWRKMCYASRAAQAELTFELVIFDRNVWVNETGDPQILIQYKDVEVQENIRNGDSPWSNGVPFPSVGISSPDGKSGVSYCFNNSYPVTSAPLQDRQALLFTVTPVFLNTTWRVYGQVTDAETRDALPGVRITTYTAHGFIVSTETDSTGRYELRQIPLEVDWWLRFNKQGYNDTLAVVDPGGGNEDSLDIELNLAMLHPEFLPSTWEILVRRGEEDSIRFPFNIQNRGNGPLHWKVKKELPGEAASPPWTLRRSIDVGQILDDDRIQGVAFANDRYYIAGSNADDSNSVYVLNREEELVETFVQPGNTRYGFRDLEWDGELLWGAGDTTIYGMNPDGELIRDWRGPFGPSNSIAWDSDHEILYLSGTTTQIARYDRAGNVLGNELPRKGLRIYGLAYWPDDPDGYCLYITSTPTPQQRFMYKMNTLTADTIMVHELDPMDGTGMDGLFITNQYDIYSWVCMTIVNITQANGGDKLAVYQLQSNMSWFNVQPVEGTVQAGNIQDFILDLNMTGLPDTLWEGSLDFTNNADSGFVSIPIRVGRQVSVTDQPGIPVSPFVGNIFPNPFNGTVRISFELPEASRASIRVFDISGREVAILVNGNLQAGNHEAVWNAEMKASGIYLVKMETPSFTATKKVTLIK